MKFPNNLKKNLADWSEKVITLHLQKNLSDFFCVNLICKFALSILCINLIHDSLINKRFTISLQEKVWLNITHFPWPTDGNCKNYSVQFAKPGEIPVRDKLYSDACPTSDIFLFLDTRSGELSQLRKHVAPLSDRGHHWLLHRQHVP